MPCSPPPPAPHLCSPFLPREGWLVEPPSLVPAKTWHRAAADPQHSLQVLPAQLPSGVTNDPQDEGTCTRERVRDGGRQGTGPGTGMDGPRVAWQAQPRWEPERLNATLSRWASAQRTAGTAQGLHARARQVPPGNGRVPSWHGQCALLRFPYFPVCFWSNDCEWEAKAPGNAASPSLLVPRGTGCSGRDVGFSPSRLHSLVPKSALTAKSVGFNSPQAP